MRVVDAYWDTKSLGKKTFELSVDELDSLEDIQNTLQRLDAEYLVVKVSSGSSEVSMKLQEMGFYFIEEQITMEHDLHEVNRNSVLQRMYDSMSYSIMDDAEFDTLLSEVKDGLFSTDRISLDPQLGMHYAVKRYVNWIKQLRESKAYLYALKYKDDLEGFVIIKETNDERIYESVLGGAFKKYRNSGLGLVQKEQDIVKKLGGKKLYTTVSSNNVSQVKALVTNGYIPMKITRVFIRHN